ncbi:MAG TPA: metalloregulator ArsR/SmtB family transcription factor [Actinomycetota bacterium]
MNLSRNAVRSSAEAARAFSALGDPARMAILAALSRGTRCVCELVPQLGLAQNLLSYHLRILREAGLVSGARTGRRIEYTIEPDGLQALQQELEDLVSGSGGRVR